jgi:hypothetical protein
MDLLVVLRGNNLTEDWNLATPHTISNPMTLSTFFMRLRVLFSTMIPIIFYFLKRGEANTDDR